MRCGHNYNTKGPVPDKHETICTALAPVLKGHMSSRTAAAATDSQLFIDLNFSTKQIVV